MIEAMDMVNCKCTGNSTNGTLPVLIAVAFRDG